MATFDTQGPYLSDLASGNAGEPGLRDANTTVLSMLVDDGSVAPGQAVGFGATDRSVRLSGGGFAGVVQLDKSALFPEIPADQYVSVLRAGTIKILVATPVSTQDAVTFDPATGAIGAGLSTAIPNASFVRGAAAGEIVFLRLERTAAVPADGGQPVQPAWTDQPSFTDPNPTVGGTVTVDPGTLTGTAPIDVQFEYLRLDGADRTSETVGLSWDSAGEVAGTVTARLRATNAAGTVLSDEITVPLADAATGGSAITSLAAQPRDGFLYDSGAFRLALIHKQVEERNNKRTRADTTKEWGVDPAEPGMSESGGIVYVDMELQPTGQRTWDQVDLSGDVVSTTVTAHLLEDWYFGPRPVVVYSASTSKYYSIQRNVVQIEPSDLPLVVATSHFFHFTCRPNLGGAEGRRNVIVQENSFNGPLGVLCGKTPALIGTRHEGPANGMFIGGSGPSDAHVTGQIRRNHVECASADGIKANMLRCHFAYNSARYRGTMPDDLAAYDPARTYAAEDLMLYPKDGTHPYTRHLYIARQETTGNAPSGTKNPSDDTPFIANIDIHGDTYGFFSSGGGSIIEYNFGDKRPEPGRQTHGDNNEYRLVTNNPGHLRLGDTLRYNVGLRLPRSDAFPNQDTTAENVSAGQGATSIWYGNKFDPNINGRIIRVGDGEPSPDFYGNIRGDTGLIFNDTNTTQPTGVSIPGNGAQVRVSGTTDAADGTAIRVRAVLDSDPTTEIYAAQIVATASGGTFSGQFEAPRHAEQLRIEAWVDGNPGGAVLQTGAFRSGHIWAYFEQSNWARVTDDTFSDTAKPALQADGFVSWCEWDTVGGAVEETVLTGATAGTASMRHLANVLMQERPNEHIAIAAFVRPGTSPADMIDAPEETDTNWAWSEVESVFDYLTGSGATQPGLITANGWISWLPQSGNAASMTPIFFQKAADGTPHSIGDQVFYRGGTQTLSNSLVSLGVDWTKTAFAYVGTHGRATSGSRATFREDNDVNLVDLETEWDAILRDEINFPMCFPDRFSTMGAIRGEPGEGGYAHHRGDEADGLPRLAELGAVSMLAATGLAGIRWPEFDRMAIAGDQSSADVWATGYDITTLNVARAGSTASLKGFEKDNIPLTSGVTLQAGVGDSGEDGVRITTAMTPSTVLEWGYGRQPGVLTEPDDYTPATAVMRDFPVVAVGNSGVLVPVRVRTLGLVPNPLPQPQSYTIDAANPTWWVFGNAPGPDTIRVQIRGAYQSASDQRTVDISGSQFRLDVRAGGVVRVRIGSTTTNLDSVSFGVSTDIDLLFNRVAGTVDATIGGVAQAQITGASIAAIGGTVSIHGSSSGGFGGSGTFEFVRIWYDDGTTDIGTAPVGAPDVEVSGSAATVNALGGKQGADAT